jgi:hypothetical protein
MMFERKGETTPFADSRDVQAKNASVKPYADCRQLTSSFYSADTRKAPRIALGGKGVGVRLRAGYQCSFWSAIFMKNDKSKEAVAEIIALPATGRDFPR